MTAVGPVSASSRTWQYGWILTRILAIAVLAAGWGAAAGAAVGQDVSQLPRQIERCSEAEDYASAATLTKQLLDYRLRTLGQRHPQTLDAMHDYAFYLIQDEQHAVARPFAEKAYELRKEILGDTHQKTLKSMNNLISTCNETRDWKAAVKLQEEYLRIRLKQVGTLNKEIALETLYLGFFYKQLRDFKKARDYYVTSLQIHQRVLGEQHLETAVAHNNLGLTLYELGDYAEALSHVEFAYTQFEKQLGNDHPHTASTADSLGFLLDLQGNTQEALPYYKKALDIRLRIFGEDHLSTAYSYNKMGLVYSDQRDYEQAEAYYRKALTIFRNELSDDDPGTALLLNNLSGCVQRQKRYQEAKQLAQESLEIYRRLYDNDNPEIADVLAKLGGFCYDDGDYEESKQYYESAIAILQQQLSEIHPDVITYQVKLAAVLAAMDQWDEAIAQSDVAFRNTNQHIRQTLVGLNSSEQLNYLKMNLADWERGYSFALFRQDDPEVNALTSSWLINSKGIAQETLANRSVLANLQAKPQLAQLSNQLIETRQNLAHLVIAAPEPDEADARREEIARLQQTEKLLSRQLIREMGPVSIKDSWVELDDVRGQIEPGQVLLNFARFTPYKYQVDSGEKYWQPARYVAWIIPAQGEGDIQVVDLSLADQLEASIETVREHMTQAAMSTGPLKQKGEELAEKDYRETFAPLVENLWKPLAEHLPSGTNKLILCPDNALWLLPWSAIPHEDGKYLVEEYSLRYLISGRELVAQPINLATNPPLLFADPDFDLSPQLLWQSLRSIFRDLPVRPDTTRSVVSHTSLAKVAPLPATRLEALAIAPSIQQITEAEPIKYLGKYALEGE
ncbi:tetratricopeptide repeat protein, partial [Bremerella sp.]|uniref:tetratricopeptide repeat protein n=1 Tax=Bremerella sp. TaxID=2795602 RepID=UPI00391D6411